MPVIYAEKSKQEPVQLPWLVILYASGWKVRKMSDGRKIVECFRIF